MTKNRPVPTHLLAEKPSRIDADLLIPGRGEAVKQGTLVWKDDKILYAGDRKSLPSDYATLEAIEVPVVMPGMWDCHVHFLGSSSTSLEGLVVLPQALAGARLARDAAATLNAGFTSVRELAGYGIELSTAINEGWIPGPNIYSSHSILSMTAGHGDLHSMPLELVQDRIRHGMPLALCDGVPECIKAVREQIRRGAKVIKICATGGVLSLIDDPKHAEFSPAEIKVIIEEAERAELLVAAHCHGRAGIMNALEAGVKTIEHGSYLDKEAIQLMARRDAILVATRTIVEFGISHLGDFNKKNADKMQEVADAHKIAYAEAVKAGVTCALGTDLGFSNAELDHQHGMNGREFPLAVKAGMTPSQAIEAGTANGPLTLGKQAPKSGQLKEGYDADFIAVAEDPLENIEALATPEKITHVWKSGRLFKSPGKQVSILP